MKNFNGKILFLDRADINTDEIIPAKYLTESTKVALKPYCLEDLILRFTFPGRTSPRPVSPRPVEHAVVGQYMTCDTDDKRKEFLDALGGEKRFGLKARALVVRCLYSRGVTDYETLDLCFWK